METTQNLKPLIVAGTVLGLGLGGFFDGILFHQILQIHNMLSNRLFPDTLVNEQINMFWDGLFHAFTWTATVLGLSFLWKASGRRDVPRSTKALIGSMLFGWGLFNFVEGIIDHQILQVHHVMQRAPAPDRLYWDLAFLAWGLAMIIIGQYLIRSSKKETLTEAPSGKSRPKTFQWKLTHEH